MAGFSSPSILFLNTWDAPERKYLRSLLTRLPQHGYTRYVEPFAGAFAMPLVAVDAGWKPSQIHTSDVSLFASILGTLFSGADLNTLGVTVDGVPATLNGKDAAMDAAHLLWLQLLARLRTRPDVEYWNQLIEDVEYRQDEHETAIAEKLRSMKQRIGGLSFKPMTVWEQIERVADDPNTVIVTNPPTYKGGYEKFFDTRGSLAWNGPDYDVFDPMVEIPEIVERMQGRKALLICQQQREPGDSAHPQPVFARHLSLGQYVYVNSNRPEEVFGITGGPKVAVRKGNTLSADDFLPIPTNHTVTRNSTVQIVPVKATVADYFRGIWLHRLVAQPGSMNLLVLVDGYAAGVIGYSIDAMAHSFADKWSDYLILRFAIGAPHDTLRLTRLATGLSLQEDVARLAATKNASVYLAASIGLLTVEMTRHPESKGLRGLMEMQKRDKHPDGWKLFYTAPWGQMTIPETLNDFLTKEERWAKQRQNASK